MVSLAVMALLSRLPGVVDPGQPVAHDPAVAGHDAGTPGAAGRHPRTAGIGATDSRPTRVSGGRRTGGPGVDAGHPPGRPEPTLRATATDAASSGSSPLGPGSRSTATSSPSSTTTSTTTGGTDTSTPTSTPPAESTTTTTAPTGTGHPKPSPQNQTFTGSLTPSRPSATVSLPTDAGAVSASATWTGAADMALHLTCPGGQDADTGTSGITASTASGGGTCYAELDEASARVTAAYSMTVDFEG